MNDLAILVRMSWPRAHWFVGTLTLALFPLAGVYMRYETFDGNRTDVTTLETVMRMIERTYGQFDSVASSRRRQSSRRSSISWRWPSPRNSNGTRNVV